MKKILLVLAVLAALCVMSTFVFAQAGLAGKWTGEQPARGGPQPITLQLKMDAGKLTGTLTIGKGEAAPIADGKVDGAKVSFTTMQSFSGGSLTISWEAELKGEELSLGQVDTNARANETSSGRAIRGGGEPPRMILKRSK